MVSMLDIVFVVAEPAVVEAHFIVVVVPATDVIPLPSRVLGLTIEKSMSIRGWREGFVSTLALILACIQHQQFKRIFAELASSPTRMSSSVDNNLSSD